VGEFADQSDIATTARKQLAALGGTTSSTLTARRIDVAGGSSISADGRWMAIIDRAAGGDVAVRDMSTGQINRLMANVGPEKCGTAEAPVFSPDVRQVAFLCYEHDPDNPSRSLRVMANEPGAKSRILVRNREFLYVTPAAWSSDGKAILVQLWRFDNTAQLAWVSAVDGSVRPLKSLEWRQPDRPSVSPDGRYITYSALVRAGSEERHIFVLMADGSGETELVKTAGVNSAPVWMPDGAHILFSSDQSGSLSLWSLPFRNGKAAGSASLVKADIGRISPIGVTRSGSYYYVQTRGGEDVSPADFRDGKVQGVSRTSDRFVGSNHGAAWSPDGRFMAFKRQRPGQATWFSGYDVVVRSLETGEEKTYAGALTTGMPLRLSWSHDGKAILLGAADKQNRISYQRLYLNKEQ
jgi:Tol biopolymer transport system component